MFLLLIKMHPHHTLFTSTLFENMNCLTLLRLTHNDHEFKESSKTLYHSLPLTTLLTSFTTSTSHVVRNQIDIVSTSPTSNIFVYIVHIVDIAMLQVSNQHRVFIAYLRLPWTTSFTPLTMLSCTIFSKLLFMRFKKKIKCFENVYQLIIYGYNFRSSVLIICYFKHNARG